MTALTAERARQLVSGFASKSIVVLGDVMLDEFVIGRVDRLSPEAPVPIVLHERDEYRVGGAANVAHNLGALGGGRVTLIGVTGADAAAERLGAELSRLGFDPSSLVVDRDRPTTRKLRVVTTRHQQVSRIDYEDDHDVTPPVENALLERIHAAIASASAVLVSDYLKGTVTRRVMAELIAVARRANVPVLVDPKIPHLEYYAGATVVTPNHHEAEVATHTRIRTDEEARAGARRFRERARCESVVITRGEHGMWLLDGSAPDAPIEAGLPAAAREVADVTGAGDTVIAALALCLAAGGRLLEAVAIANLAAGIVVGRFGVATVASEELLATIE